eukprot:TRINITY_DN14933_c1_g3_i1.p1 TRINITY_DN14933_c1_g3~~TRINITY_DN14933_c1_g3_i1.p1  ORF type:complete len:263 (+),score=56.79 TRINITY_DN14933_c1_g3_i1:64-852(+)
MSTFRSETRATKYQQKFKLPPNFPETLREYTREVLRNQPTDIYDWSSAYFKEKALIEDGVDLGNVREEVLLSDSERELGLRLEDAFGERDTENTGELFVQLCKAVLLESLGLTEAQALYILSNPDIQVTPQGTINHKDLLLIPDLLHQIVYFQTTGHEFTSLPVSDPNFLIHGTSREETSHLFTTAFKAADTSSHGTLTIPQYRSALGSVPIQLTCRDISLLVLEAPLTGDSVVPWKEVIDSELYLPLLALGQVFSQFGEQE